VASLYPKKIGGKTYWYLREMARVGGKPKMVSERYLGTAADIAAAVEGAEAAVLPERTRHLAFGDVAAAWGLLEDLGVAAVLEGGVRGLVEDHRRGPVHQDPRDGAGSPAVLGRHACCHRRAAGGGLPEDRGADRAGIRRGLLVGGAGHDQLRDLHRHGERQGADRAARQGQAEAERPAADRPGAGGHPGRRDPADLARLPRRPA